MTTIETIFELLSSMKEYEKCDKFGDIKLVLYSDGSGRAIEYGWSMQDEELIEFDNTDEMLEFLEDKQ